jgi:hypothetical protein
MEHNRSPKKLSNERTAVQRFSNLSNEAAMRLNH